LISDRMEPEIKSASEDTRDEEPGPKEVTNSEMNKEQEVEAEEDTVRLEVKKGEAEAEDTVRPEVKKGEAEAEDTLRLEVRKEEVEAEDTVRLEVKKEEAESEDDDDRELTDALVPEIKLEEGAVKLEIKQEVEEDDDMDQDGSLGCHSQM
jgi:hypothetical protein